MKRAIYFTATWCQPCKSFAPVLYKVAEANGVAIQKVDVNENPALANEWHVMSLPTVLWIKDNAVQAIQVGPLNEAGLLKYIEKIR